MEKQPGFLVDGQVIFLSAGIGGSVVSETVAAVATFTVEGNGPRALSISDFTIAGGAVVDGEQHDPIPQWSKRDNCCGGLQLLSVD